MKKFTLLIALFVCAIGFSQQENASIETLLSRLDQVGTTSGSISDYFTQSEQITLRNHFTSLNSPQRIVNTENRMSSDIQFYTDILEPQVGITTTNRRTLVDDIMRIGGTATFTDVSNFQAACSGTLVSEDFSGGPAPGTGVMACGLGPMSSAGNGCYAPGVLEDDFEIEAFGAGTIETVWIETTFLGNTIDLVGPNSFGDTMSLAFTGPDDVFDVGMIIWNNSDPDTSFRIYDQGGVLQETFNLNNTIATENFFGVMTDYAIGHIELEGLNGSGELVGSLLFGDCAAGGGGGGPSVAYCSMNATAEYGTFDPLDGSVVTVIGPSPAVGFENAGSLDPNDTATAYVLDNGGDFYSVDVASGVYTLLGNIPGDWTAAEFDPISGDLYGFADTSLHLIDIAGVSSNILGGTGLAFPIGLAIDGAGNAYTYDVGDDNFYSVDLGTGAVTLIGSIGFDANFGQGMAWDPGTDTVFMTSFNLGLFDSEWRSVDTATGMTTVINQMDAGGLTQYAWVTIDGGAPLVDNDLCADAYDINCGDVATGDTSDNTDTGGNPATDEWYSFTGDGAPEFVTISLCDGGTGYDSLLRVFDACGGTEIAANDDFCGLQSELTFTSNGTSTYYIMVEGFGSSSGAYSLEVSCVLAPPPPANDLCVDAIDVSCGESVSGTTIDATIDTDVAPDCDTGVTSPGVWYTFTDTSGLVSDITLTMCSGNGTADYDTKMSVYTGDCGAPPLTCVVGNDDTCGLQSEVSFQSDGVSTYYILVHGFGGGTGNFTFDVNCTPVPPPNDDIADAITIVDCPFTDTAVAMPAATIEGGNPVGCNIDGVIGVWYNITPAGDGTITATIVTPSGLSHVTFYTADDENATESELTLVIDTDNQCVPGTTTTIPVVEGQTYYVYVANTGGITDISFECDLLAIGDNVIEGFSFYPNPTSDIINLNAQDNIENVSIFNVLGQKVIDQNVNATTSQINVANLTTGTYIMKATVNGITASYKVIKN